MKRILSIIGMLVLVCGLLMGNVGSIFAQQAQPQTIYGVVAEDGVNIDDSGAGSITLEGMEEPINVDPNTRYHVLGLWQTWKAGLVKPYNRIAVLVSDGTASQVMVIPTHAVHEHLVGVVVEVGPTTITIVDGEGNEVTIDKGAVRNVAERDYATIIAKRMPQAPPRAMSYRNLEQLVERLQSHLENAQSQEAFERLNALLDEAHSKHMLPLRKLLSQWQTVEGIVAGVDVTARTVRVAIEGGELITVQVSPFTLIMKNGRHAFLRDVAQGDIVEKLVYSTETFKAAKLVLASSVTGEGRVEVRVTDAPPAYNVTSIVVVVDKVEIHKAGGNGEKGEWIPLDIVNPTFDLKELQKEDLEEILAAGNITAGKYTQICMTIKEVKVTLGGGEPSPETILPSNKLKFVRPFDVVDGRTTILTLDFDANKSVIVTGAGKVILKPVVKLTVTPATAP